MGRGTVYPLQPSPHVPFVVVFVGFFLFPGVVLRQGTLGLGRDEHDGAFTCT